MNLPPSTGAPGLVDMIKWLLVITFCCDLQADMAEDLAYANAFSLLGEGEKAVPLYLRLLTEEIEPYQRVIIDYDIATAYLKTGQEELALSYLQEVAPLEQLPSLIRGNIFFNSAVAFKQMADKNQDLKGHYLKQAKELLEMSKKSWCSWRAIKGDPTCPPVNAIMKLQKEIESSLAAAPAATLQTTADRYSHLLNAKEDESESSIALRRATVALLKEGEKIAPSSAKEILQRGITLQKGARQLAEMLPFLDPYKEPTSLLVTNFQQVVISSVKPFKEALIQLQRDMFTKQGMCPTTSWEAINEHFVDGLDVANFAHKRLSMLALPYSGVIPLMDMAVKEWEKALSKLEKISREPNKPLEEQPQSRLERLKDLFDEDKEPTPTPRLAPKEGIIW